MSELAPIRHNGEFDIHIPDPGTERRLRIRHDLYRVHSDAARVIFHHGSNRPPLEFYDFLVKYAPKLIEKFPGFRVERVPFPIFGRSEIEHCVGDERYGSRLFLRDETGNWQSYNRLCGAERPYIEQTQSVVAQLGIESVASLQHRSPAQIAEVLERPRDDASIRSRILRSHMLPYMPRAGNRRYAKFDAVPPYLAHRFREAGHGEDREYFLRIVSDPVLAQQKRRAAWRARVLDWGMELR